MELTIIHTTPLTTFSNTREFSFQTAELDSSNILSKVLVIEAFKEDSSILLFDRASYDFSSRTLSIILKENELTAGNKFTVRLAWAN